MNNEELGKMVDYLNKCISRAMITPKGPSEPENTKTLLERGIELYGGKNIYGGKKLGCYGSFGSAYLVFFNREPYCVVGNDEGSKMSFAFLKTTRD